MKVKKTDEGYSVTNEEIQKATNRNPCKHNVYRGF